MLVLNRIDALIHTDVYGLSLMHELGLQDKVEVAPFRYTRHNPVYIAVSKKSKLIKRKDRLEEVFKKMIESGEVDKVIHNFFETQGLPVPEYK